MFLVISFITFFVMNTACTNVIIIENGLKRDKIQRQVNFISILKNADLERDKNVVSLLKNKDDLFDNIYGQINQRNSIINISHQEMTKQLLKQEIQQELKAISMESDWIVLDGERTMIPIKRPFLSKKGIASLALMGSLFTAAVCCNGLSVTDINFACRALISQKLTPEHVFYTMGRAFYLIKPSALEEGFSNLTNSWSTQQIYDFFHPIEYVMDNHDWELWGKIQNIWVETGGKVPALQLLELASKALGR